MKNNNIDNLTFGEIKQLTSLFSNQNTSNEHPFQVGKAYLIRTVTMTLVGKLEGVFEKELILSNASWVADTGRFYDSIKNGLDKTESEIEPFTDDVIVGRGAIIDMTVYSHNLPTKQK